RYSEKKRRKIPRIRKSLASARKSDGTSEGPSLQREKATGTLLARWHAHWAS
ncbi:hypothetical protein A2U01_0117305, partial [Trifolium medium]|nr:hypothetical protein [Trifolium medium]